MSAKNIIYKLVTEQKLSPKDAALLFKQLNEGERKNGDIAIIGISGKLPGARNAQEYWENLRNGKNCIGEFPGYRRQDTDPFLPESLKKLDDPYSAGGYLDEIDKFDSAFFRISPKEAKWMHPSQRLFLATSWEAMEDAGYSPEKIHGTRTGVYVGVDQTFKMDYGSSAGEQDSTTVTGSWTGILAGRLSYILNLRGPSVVVDSACSSGLVAVHMACKALKNNECELAVAGGISLMLFPCKNNSLTMVESKDNLVKTFDKNATGTVWGEGVCSFLLKPLSKALADRDNIYAVIKGSAVNNDGASSALTAPDAEAQEEVITRAWEEARIDPETIAYIEAHGTGTVLGDPIEVKGLTMAFERYTDKKQFCAIGSVKTNIGHLVGASGTASLLKVVLMLKNKEIPPSINFKEPNPYINFYNTPLYINDTLVKRDADNAPVRAGVSSFGFSGTNCHMVLEGAPDIPVDPGSKGGKPYIFTLSAKSESSFRNLVKRYIDFLDSDTGLSLGDICYTAALGRGHYTYRLAMMVKSKQDLKHMLGELWNTGLKQPDEKGVYYQVHKLVAENKESKGANEITEREKNHLSEKVVKELEGLPGDAALEEICSLYVKGADIDWENVYKGLPLRKVSLPVYPFEPVRYWIDVRAEKGVPGETADEASTVRTEGRLSSLIDKSLVDTMRHETLLTRLSVEGCWLLDEHKAFESSVVPGTGYIEFFIQACKKYFPGSALELRDVFFTSPLIVNRGEMRDVYTILNKGKDCLEVSISTRGESEDEWLLHSECKAYPCYIQKMPECDIDEIRSRCSINEFTGIGIKDINGPMFNYGPRWDNLRRISVGNSEILAEIELPEIFIGDLEDYYTHAALLDNAVNAAFKSVGEGIYAPYSYKSFKVYRQMPRKFYSHIKLQDGDFKGRELVTFDVSLIDENGRVFAEIEEYRIKRVNEKELRFGSYAQRKNLLHEICWVPSAIECKNPDFSKESILVFNNESETGKGVSQKLKDAKANVIEVKYGSGYSRTSDNCFTVGDPEDDYFKLFEELKGGKLTRIIHMLTLDGNRRIESIEDIEEMKNKGIYSLFNLVRPLEANKYSDDVEIVLISDYANQVTKQEEKINPLSEALFGLGKCVNFEFGNIKCRCIDIDGKTTADDIILELGAPDRAYKVSYRNNIRYVEEFRRLHIESVEDREFEVRENGVYVITGGTGGIGLEVARYLASRNKVRLCLVSRSKFSSREDWNSILEEARDRKACQKINIIKEIENSGSVVALYSADVSREEEIKGVLSEISDNFGRINGVIHSAGLAGDGFILRKDRQKFEEVLAPKIQGTWLLDRLTEQHAPDIFIMFSSITALTGDYGQGDYTAANSFMDSFAAYRSNKAGRTLTINWPTWKETGMAVDFGVNRDHIVFKAITTENAITALEQILNKDISRVIASELVYQIEKNYDLDRLPIKFSNPIKARFNKEKNGPQPGRTQNINIRLIGRDSGEYTETEKQIAHVWGNVLEIGELDIHDNFYDLGGDSVQAIKISNIISKNIGRDINMSDIFEHLTIKDLAFHLEKTYSEEQQRYEGANGIQIVEDTPYDLSHSQDRMWFLQKFDPELVAYNLPSNIILEEELDIEILNKTIEFLAGRHTALRTVFVEVDGFPKQLILKRSEHRIEFVDLSGLGNSMQVLEKSLYNDNRTVFDLSKRTYLLKLYKIDHSKYCFYYNFHHIIMDGWSVGVFRNELIKTYIAFSKGVEPDLTPLKMNYIDIVYSQKEWIKSEEFMKAEEYWLNELAKPLPVLNLPVDYSRPQLQTFDGSFIKYRIDKSKTSKLKELSKELNSTLFMLFLSSYFVLLNKIASDEDIVIGTLIAGRDSGEHEKIIGLLMNTLCIRVNFEGIHTFKQLLDTVRNKCYLAFRNSKYPFDLLVSKVNPERDLSRSPIFSTVFQFYDIIPDENESVSQFELSILCKEIDNEIEVRLEYNTGIFKREHIERIWNYYRNILDQVLENPDRKMDEIELLSKGEKDQLLNMFSSIKKDVQYDLTMHKLFELQVKETPEATALIYEGDSITYKELNERANRLAHLLRNEGVKPDEPVGIMMQRGMDMVTGILGILKAGGAYVPIDPTYPSVRVSYMLSHSETRIVVTENALIERMEELMRDSNNVETVVNLTEKVQIEIPGVRKIFGINDIEKQECDDLPSISSSDELMYIIYTSGSTGLPKGVMVTHKNAVNYIKWSIEDGKLGADDRMLLVTSISFDISVFEIFGALVSGAALVIVSESRLRDPAMLWEYTEKNSVTIWHSVPTLMAQLLITLKSRKEKGSIKTLSSIRRIMIGGEAWSIELAKEIKENFKNTEIVNMYGPTEATIWVTSYNIGDELEKLTSIPIGRPISNNRVIILDSKGKLCPIGVQGDIYISGANVTRGYYKDEEKTGEVFIYNEEMQAAIYKTGDMGRYLDNGNIEYLGRKDGMVKVRGYRIEAGEIESVLLSREDISQTAVIAKKTGDTNKLVCFYVSDITPSLDELKGYLQQKLPEYMVPSQFVQLDSMPLTPNGKIDRKSLAAIEVTGRPQLESEFMEPVTEVEKYLAEILKELLDTDRVGVHDNFFSLGGNSFLVTQMRSRIEKEYPGRVKIVDIFKYPTISKLSQYIEEIGEEKTGEDERAIDEQISGDITVNYNHPENMKIIQNVEPFNDVYYKNCFYNSLFSVVSSFDKNPLRFLINDVVVYEYRKGKDKIKFDAVYSPVEDIRQLFNNAGIGAEIKEESSDIIGDIIASISKDRLVIVWIDLFYDSMRPEMYNEAHWSHTLVVYGYNEDEKTLNIIEHKHREYLKYEKLTISYSDLVNSYKGYLDNLKDQVDGLTFYEFFPAPDGQSAFDTDDCISVYARNIYEKKDMIINGLENIKVFGEDLERIFASESELKENIEFLLNTFNNILNVKRVEKYKVEKLFGPRHELNKHLYGIIDIWGLIRKAVAKYSYTSMYNKKELDEALSMLNKIYMLECRYNEKLFEVNHL